MKTDSLFGRETNLPAGTISWKAVREMRSIRLNGLRPWGNGRSRPFFPRFLQDFKENRIGFEDL